MNTVATDTAVLKHWAIYNHNPNKIFIVLDQFNTKILPL